MLNFFIANLAILDQGQSSMGWPILISWAEWIIFSICWDAMGKNAAPTQTRESILSRAAHVFMSNLALVLILAPVPGLSRRFMPNSPFVAAAGILIQTMGLLLAFWSRQCIAAIGAGK